MATVDNPLFAEDDFSAFATEERLDAPVSRGWDGQPPSALVPPSPLLDAAKRDGKDAETGGGRAESSVDLRKRRERRERQRRALEAKNDELEREISILRLVSKTRMEEATATRVNAFRHLRAAEDHVKLLLAESAAKLDSMAAEKENRDSFRGNTRDGDVRYGTGTPPRTEERTDRPGVQSPPVDAAGHQSRVTRRAFEFEEKHILGKPESEAARLRAELAVMSATRAEMDAEAEEREGELEQAMRRIAALEATARRAGIRVDE